MNANTVTDIGVVLIEDDEDVRHGCAQALELAGFEVYAFDRIEAAQALVRPDAALVLLCDVMLPGMHATEWLPQVHALDPELPMILMTGHGDIAMAVQAMRAGAYDFIEKPASSERIVTVVQRAAQGRRLALKVRALQQRLSARDGIDSVMLGDSPAMQKLRQNVLALASTSADVLIYGETGSGKDVVARCLHEYSERSRGHLVAINCGGLPEALVENELFGHEAGAFTGAQKARAGKIENANGGTLFLDEIESMPLSIQVKLLRVLQERSVERLGSNTAVPVDCRVVAASKTDLLAHCSQGHFRSDLYYRIAVTSIDIPPLRERREDIAMLFEHFAMLAAARYEREVPALTSAQQAELIGYHWPGNLRELCNVATRWVLGLQPQGLTPNAPSGSTGFSSTLTHAQHMEQFERALIADALRRHHGDVMASAKALGLPKQTLYDKLHRLDLQGGSFRSSEPSRSAR